MQPKTQDEERLAGSGEVVLGGGVDFLIICGWGRLCIIISETK